MFFICYSIAALRLNASISAVSFSTCELPTELAVLPSSYDPTPSSGCSLTPFSMILPISLNDSAYLFNLY